MKLYAFAWFTLSSVITAIGVVLALALLPPPAILALAGTGACAGAALHRPTSRWAAEIYRSPIRKSHLVASSAALCLALAGLLAFLGSVALSVVFLLALGAAPLVGAGRTPPATQGTQKSITKERARDVTKGIGRRVRTPDMTPRPEDATTASAPDFDEQLLRPVVMGWPDRQLCEAWRRSFARLQQADGVTSAAAMAQVRRLYLDELQRRHPEEFDVWMSSGARAASDPGRYLNRGEHRSPHQP